MRVYLVLLKAELYNNEDPNTITINYLLKIPIKAFWNANDRHDNVFLAYVILPVDAYTGFEGLAVMGLYMINPFFELLKQNLQVILNH